MRAGSLWIVTTFPVLYGTYILFNSYPGEEDGNGAEVTLDEVSGLLHKNPFDHTETEMSTEEKEHRRIKAIHIIGERHSGSDWLASHLGQCFGGSLPMGKGVSRGGSRGHEFLFQYDNADHRHKDSLVIAMFRSPYEWVESMRKKPFSAPEHANLDWKDFVSKPWTMPRWGVDLNITDFDGRICADNFHFHDVVPCDQFLYKENHARYEHKPGKLGEPYQSITELRAEKIRNFLGTKSYSKVLDMWALRYEDVMSEGTADLILRIEKVTGAKANCTSLPPQDWKKPTLENDYIGWLNRHIDWDVERFLGYKKVSPHLYDVGAHLPTSSSLTQKWPRETDVERSGRYTEDEQGSNAMEEKLTKENKNGTKIRAIHFIGERHSGTNWIFFHLKDCFGHAIPFHQGITRWKHWFQSDDNDKVHADSLVIAQFRNAYEWVDALIDTPYHSPEHKYLDWETFVTKPWTMERWGIDLKLTDMDALICQDNFRFHEITPCSGRNSQLVKPHAKYELKIDGSGTPYDSILDLRRDKIINFLETSKFEKVADMWPVRYEDFVVHGTIDIVRRIEQVTGATARCEPVEPSSRRKLMQNFDDEEWVSSHESRKKNMDPRFIQWIGDHVDWETEALIGYKKWS